MGYWLPNYLICFHSRLPNESEHRTCFSGSRRRLRQRQIHFCSNARPLSDGTFLDQRYPIIVNVPRQTNRKWFFCALISSERSETSASEANLFFFCMSSSKSSLITYWITIFSVKLKYRYNCVNGGVNFFLWYFNLTGKNKALLRYFASDIQFFGGNFSLKWRYHKSNSTLQRNWRAFSAFSTIPLNLL